MNLVSESFIFFVVTMNQLENEQKFGVMSVISNWRENNRAPILLCTFYVNTKEKA